MVEEARVIYWFRTDLRVHDSPALNRALDLKPSALFPVWTWDPHYVYRARVGPNRWKFLLESQRDLSASLGKLNRKQRLLVVREGPLTALPKLFEKWRITHLVFEKDTDAYARERDEEVTRLARNAGVQVIVAVGRTLYDPDAVVKANGSKPTMSIGQLSHAAKSIDGGVPPRCVETPGALPDPGTPEDMDFKQLEHDPPKTDPDLNRHHRGGKQKDMHYANIAGPNGDFAIVTLEEMGFAASQAPSQQAGGETEALKTLESCIKDEEFTGTFEKPRTSPTSFAPSSTTRLSSHLHFGTISVRKFWWDVQHVLDRRRKQGKKTSKEPMSLHGQLLFREMFFAAQAALGQTFAQIQGNPVCRYIPWELQTNSGQSGPTGENPSSVDGDTQAEVYLRKWKEGRTGFPWIDALMRQLRQEGWIHHLGRHAVACFLTRGGCYISWERGAEVFEEYLVDHEPASNAGNWMWLSCSAFFSQFYRCYSPVSFPKKWDPEGAFVRKYVPELKHYDKKYIYEPHKASAADQKRWNCLVKGEGEESNTYPLPMFDFDERRQICLDRMKKAYAVGLYGDDARVMHGDPSGLFSDGNTQRPAKRRKSH